MIRTRAFSATLRWLMTKAKATPKPKAKPKRRLKRGVSTERRARVRF